MPSDFPTPQVGDTLTIKLLPYDGSTEKFWLRPPDGGILTAEILKLDRPFVPVIGETYSLDGSVVTVLALVGDGWCAVRHVDTPNEEPWCEKNEELTPL